MADMNRETTSAGRGQRRALQTAAAGGVGAIVGFVLSRVTELWVPATETGLTLTQGVWYASVVGSIGAAVALAAFALDGRRPSVGMIGLGSAGLIGTGFLSGVVAQFAFRGILDDASLASCFADYRATLDDAALNWCVADSFRLPRLVGWCVAGALSGLGIGSFLASKQRAVNAVVGGATAGLIGGFLFDLIPAITSISRLWPSQLIAVIAIGVLIGLSVGLIEALRLSAWVEVLNGEFKGRTISLSERVSRVGSDRSLEVPVVGDRQAVGYHARIIIDGRGASIEPVGGVVDVNGRPGPSKIVDGDVFTVGSTSMRFRTRTASVEDSPAVRGASPDGRPTVSGHGSAPPNAAAPAAGPPPRPRIELKPRE